MAERRALELKLRDSERSVRQLLRDRERAENFALRSKIAMLATTRELQDSVAQLEAAMVELKSAKQKAERANEAKGRFIATISHELRTPMHGIIGTAELLRAAQLGQSERELLTIIERSAKGLLSIISDVLDFSKAEGGCIEIERIRFDLHAALRAVMDLQLNAARSKSLSLRHSIAPDVPRWVMGDPVRLRQVLLNLLDNALKFTCDGGVELQVAVAPKAGGHLLFSISDSGIGIAQEDELKLFQPFVQADSSTTRRFGGTGLGLAICRHLVTAMGGSIGFTSTPGTGTRFTFDCELPSTTEEPSTALAANSDPDTRFELRALVVDDNAVNRMIASRVLERLGCSVVTAEDGMIALARAATEDWDVILMDGSMPEMDGLEATRAIRSLEGPRARVRIVALTAHALESDRERFQACGMDDYLSKPIDMVRLREALHATCLSLGRHPKRSLADRGDGCELQEAQVAPG